MKKRMLITGASGFVGGVFAGRASEAFDVRRLSRGDDRPDAIRWDLTQARDGSLPPVDCVVHLASLTAKERADPTPAEEYERHNVMATRNLLAGLSADPAYLLYVSTADVYGHEHAGQISEETSLHPSTAYALSKLQGEEAALSFCAARGIPCGIARLGLIYGPGEAGYKKVIPSFIERALAGEQLRLFGAGTARRQFLYVDDLASALLLMISLERQGVLNLVGSTVTTVRGLAELVAELAGLTSEVERVPMDGPERDVLFDTSALSRLGFVETVGLREGLRRQIEWQRGR